MMRHKFGEEEISFIYDDNSSSKTIVFMHGLLSDMHGVKSSYIRNLSKELKLNYLAFDQLGHGESTGKLRDLNMSAWNAAAESIIGDRQCIIVGSSFGGYVACNLANKMSNIAGLVLLSPAIDFVQNLILKNLDSSSFFMLEENGECDIKIGDKDFTLTQQLVDDAENNIFLGNIKITAPVRILHSINDQVVPYTISVDLLSQLQNGSCTLLSGSDHSLKNSLHEIKSQLLSLL